MMGYDNGDPVLVGVTSIGVRCGDLPGASVNTWAFARWMRSKGVDITPYSKQLPILGPMCNAGEYLKFQYAVATCEECGANQFSIPPTRVCTNCAKSLLRDTINGAECSCRARVGFGRKGKRCKRCAAGTTSAVGENTCS